MREIHQSAADQSDCSWPSIGITVLQSDVDFVDGKMHERELLVIGTDTDNVNNTTKLQRKDTSRYGALDTSAFNGNGWSEACSLHNVVADLLCFLVSLDQNSPDAWNDALGKIQSIPINVRDNKRFCSCYTSAECGDDTNRSSSADHNGVTALPGWREQRVRPCGEIDVAKAPEASPAATPLTPL